MCFWLAKKQVHFHVQHMCKVVTQVQIANSLNSFKILFVLTLCDGFSCKLLTSNKMIFLAIWWNKHF